MSNINVETLATLRAENAALRQQVAELNNALHAQQELQVHSPSLLQAILDHASAAILVKDQAGRIIFSSRQHAALFAVSVNDLIGKTAYDLYPTDLAVDRWESEQRVLATGMSETLEEPVPLADGLHILLVNKFPIFNDQHTPVAVGIIATDITERKRLESALQQSHAALEQRVEARTRELALANEQLRAEITRREQAEAVLRASEMRYRETAELISDSIYSVCFKPDGTSELEWGFNGLEQLTGYTPNDISYHDWQKLVHPDDLAVVVRHIEQLHMGQSVESEYRIVTKSGVTRWLRDHARPVRDTQSNCLLRVYGAIKDVTEHRQTSEALRESERMLVTLMHNLPGMAYRCQNDWQRSMQLVSEGAQALTSYTPADLVGSATIAFGDLIHPEDRPQIWNAIQTALQSHRPFSFRYRISTASGAEKWVWEQGVGVFDNDDTLLALEGFITDITAARHAEAGLVKSEERFRQLMENMQQVFWMYDATRQQRLYVSPAYEHIYGRTCESLYQSPDSFLEAVHRDDRERIIATFKRYRTGETFDQEYRIVRPDGEIRWIHARSFPISGHSDRLAGIAEDITERKRAQEALTYAEHFKQAILDSLTDHIAVLDEHGTIVATNWSWRDSASINTLHSGMVTEGTNYYQVCESATGVWAEGAAAFVAGIRAVFAGEHDCFVLEYPWHSPDAQRWFVGRVTRFMNPDLPYVVVAHQDITERKQIEESLRISLEKYRVLFDCFPLGVTISDRSGNIIEANLEATRILGVPEAEHERRQIDGPEWQIIRPDGSPMPAEEYASVQALHEQRLISNVEMGIVKGPGQVTWISVTAAPIPLEGYGVAIAYGDITDRKRTEEALRESEARYRMLAENIRDVVWLLDRSGHFVYVSPSVYQLCGYISEEMMQHALHQMLTPESFQVMQARMQHSSHMAGAIELEQQCKDGSTVWTECVISGLYDAVGEITGWVVVSRDISDRRRTQEALRVSEERFRRMFDQSPIGAAMIALDYRFLRVNDALCQITGYNQDEMLALTVPDITHPDDQDADIEQSRHLAAGEIDQCSCDKRYICKDGHVVWVHFTRRLMHDSEGQPAYFLTLVEDITARKQLNEALQESQSLFQQILDHAPPLMIVKDLEGRYLRVNRRLLTLLGMEEDQVIGKTARDLFPGAIAAPFSANEQQVLRTGKALETEEIVLFKGRLQTNLSVLFPINDIHGTISAIGIIATDITDRKRTEEALRESEARLRMLLGALPDMVFRLDRDGIFVDFKSSRGDEPLFMPPEAFLGRCYEDVLPSALFGQLQSTIEQARQSGNVERFEYVLTLADGQQPDYEARVVVGDDGDTFCIVRNISDDKQTEVRIRQHAARAEALARVAARLNAPLDLKTILQAVCVETQQALQLDIVVISLYDAQRDAMVFADGIGIPAEMVSEIEPVPLALVDTRIPTRAVRAGEVAPTYPNLQHTDHLNVRSVMRALVMRDQEIVGMLLGFSVGQARSFTEDEQHLLQGIADQAAQAITNARLFATVQQERTLLSRRVAERTTDLSRSNAELARAVRTKDEFLTNMSHELRTPLNTILGMSEALQEQVYGPLTVRQQTSLAAIEQSGQHLLSLINDILDLSKIEAGKIDLQIGPIELEAVCHASLSFIKQPALKKRIGLSLSIDTALPPARHNGQSLSPTPRMPPLIVQADERRLKQILINLLTNAIKFTPEGGQVGLDVWIEAEHRQVHFIVWDTGIGIAPDDQRRLFQPFVQVDSSLSRQYEGTGLGLALVLRLTELHGGSVTLESEVGKGSRFTVSLPQFAPSQLALAAKADIPPSTRSSEHTSSATHHLRQVLIIEDSPSVIEQMTRYMRDLGVNDVHATSGNQALNRAREIHPDLIVLDLLLPDSSGWDILAMLKADPGTCTIPVLILSVVDEQTRGTALGAAGYLVKPISRQQL